MTVKIKKLTIISLSLILAGIIFALSSLLYANLHKQEGKESDSVTYTSVLPENLKIELSNTEIMLKSSDKYFYVEFSGFSDRNYIYDDSSDDSLISDRITPSEILNNKAESVHLNRLNNQVEAIVGNSASKDKVVINIPGISSLVKLELVLDNCEINIAEIDVKKLVITAVNSDIGALLGCVDSEIDINGCNMNIGKGVFDRVNLISHNSSVIFDCFYEEQYVSRVIKSDSESISHNGMKYSESIYYSEKTEASFTAKLANSEIELIFPDSSAKGN